MTGWRVGYAVAPPPLIDEMEKLMEHVVSGVTAVARRAALAAITGSQYCVREMVAAYDRRRQIVHRGLNAIDGVSCLKPESTFYAFPNFKAAGMSSWDLARYLVRTHRVALVPGSIFGPGGEGYLRLSFAAGSDRLREGLARIEAGLTEAEFVDADLLVNWVRLTKSETEIDTMKQAGRIVEKVMQTAIDTIEPGLRECDAVARVYQAQSSGLPDFGGDYSSIVPMMPTGEKTSAPHLTWTDEPYQNNQAANLELSACRNRYHAPLATTIYLWSKPPDKLKKLADITIEGLNTALDAIKPGVTCESIELARRKVIAREGFDKESRIGYAMGLNYPPDRGGHTAGLRAGDRTVLKPNMTFHMIVGLWMDDYGFEASESFWVTDRGCETFARFPRKLFIKN